SDVRCTELVGDLERGRRLAHPRRSGNDEHVDRWRTASRQVARDLDEVPVRISKVDGGHRAERPGSSDRSFLDRYVVGGQLRKGVLDRAGRHEADIGRAARWDGRLRLEFVTGLVEIDLLPPKGQRSPHVLAHHGLQPDTTQTKLRRPADNPY